MRKIFLLFASLVFSMGTCSQSGGTRTRDAFETKKSIFFDNSALDEFTTSVWDSSFTNMVKQERFSASRAKLEQIELTYNEKNNITTKITKDAESVLKNRVVYQYDQKGQLIVEALRDQKNKPISTYEYAYNDKGFRTERSIKSNQDKLLAKTTYTVDSNGRILRSETKDGSATTISYTEYKYDSQGNLIEQKVSNGDGVLTSIINAVWQNGNEIRNEMKSPDGTVQYRITKEYGQDGEVMKEIVENLQGQSKQILQYEYEYRPVRRQS
ncbi:MAG: hypothetical protein FWH41_07100 [Treponema sp.]|nr:hypothetical protein [Treponema sp.]